MSQPSPHPSLVHIARIVSIIGHPLLILSLSTILIAFHFYTSAKAWLISAIVIGFVIVPVTVNNLLKARKKVYTNFDVSDRKQRHSFYRFGLVVLSIGVIALYFVPGARSFFTGTLFALVMLATSAIINMKVKASLHTAVVAYMAISFYSINLNIMIGLLLFGILIAISRLILKRHTIREVLIGGLLGIIFGLLYLISL